MHIYVLKKLLNINIYFLSKKCKGNIFPVPILIDKLPIKLNLRSLIFLMSKCQKYYLWSVKEIHKTLENCRKNNLSFFLGAAPCSKRPRQDAGGHRAVQPVQPGVLLRYSTNAFLHRIHTRFELIILWNFRLRPQEYKYFQ